MKFSLGTIVVTSEVNTLIENGKIKPFEILSRYVDQDWGDTSDVCSSGPSDWELNDMAIVHRDRICAWYKTKECELLVITEHDRSSTCIQLANEY